MARAVHRSASVLAEAAGGSSLPTLETTLAFVAACRGDAQEWETRWTVVHRLASAARPSERAAAAGLESLPGGAPDARGTLWRRVARPRVLVPVGLVLAAAAAGAAAGKPAPPPAGTATAQASPTRRATAATPSATPSTTAEELSITGPADEGTVDLLNDVVIRRTGDAPGRHIWILVSFKGAALTNPQGDCSTGDGTTYTCAKAQFGDPPTRAGTQLVIEAVEVDEEGHLAMQSLVDTGFNAALQPVPFFARSAPVTVGRR